MGDYSMAAYFGVKEAAERITIEETVRPLEFRNGLNVTYWPQERIETVTAEKVFYDVWGTCPDGDANGNSFGIVIDNLTWTRTEAVGSQKLIGTQPFLKCPGAIPSTATPQLLMRTADMVWMGVEHSLSIDGKYTGISSLSVPKLIIEGAHIAPADVSGGTLFLYPVGGGAGDDSSFEYDIPDTFDQQPYVESVRRECSKDWNTISISLRWFVPQTVGNWGTSPLVETLVTWTPATLSEKFFKITKTLTLSATDNPRLSETVEVYEETDDPDWLIDETLPGDMEGHHLNTWSFA